ncbi:MAG: hypothetical protein KDD29_00810 [Flavobacteriales bacterium]|nr:hypothetical protein [Flavobacteriales bacterium]MCB9336016.1 hypothetical protein [Flavobacteriales bacterium]
MKELIFCVAIFLFACQQGEIKNTPKTNVESKVVELTFDSIKAINYGADEYGMKKYVMAFLKKGPNRDLDSASAYELQAAHLANIGKMAEAGKLVLAGPFFGNGDLRGIYIFDVTSIEEAKQLTETDPAIQAGSLIMELQEWYGSAALMEVGDIHKTIAKTEI